MMLPGRSRTKAGDDVLSHRVPPAVPSAQRGLTAVFGMGTGVSPALLSPTIGRSREGAWLETHHGPPLAPLALVREVQGVLPSRVHLRSVAPTGPLRSGGPLPPSLRARPCPGLSFLVLRPAFWCVLLPECQTGRGAGQASRGISTARLHVSPRFHLPPINVVVSYAPSEGLHPGSAHLGVGFPLRCFQRLSRPDVATRRCRWRDNRYTSGRSVPVLSY